MEPGPDELDPQVLTDPLSAEPALDETVKALPQPAGRSIVPADPFRRYMAEVSRFPPLDREEEVKLARLYRDTGDRQALFRLVTANLVLVVRVALSFRRAARNLLDLIQEGNLGLLAAVERFDPELGVRLPTYAGWWVRAYMVKFLLDNVRLVRVGTTNARRKLLRNLRQEKQRLEGLGFDVGPKLLAEHFGVSVHDVQEVQQALDSRDVSLDEPLEAGGERRRGDVLADAAQPSVEDTVARREFQQRAEAALSRFRATLSERDLALLNERILSESPKTLAELGQRFGTTREAVRQAEARLMKRLKQFLEQDLGKPGTIHVGRR